MSALSGTVTAGTWEKVSRAPSGTISAAADWPVDPRGVANIAAFLARFSDDRRPWNHEPYAGLDPVHFVGQVKGTDWALPFEYSKCCKRCCAPAPSRRRAIG